MPSVASWACDVTVVPTQRSTENLNSSCIYGACLELTVTHCCQHCLKWVALAFKLSVLINKIMKGRHLSGKYL